jgi:hypothetical protein
MREILARALDPEIQERIREAVRDSLEAGDPVWRELMRGADVVLDGEKMIVLAGNSLPLEKDFADLREEAMQLITSAGRVGVVVNFAREVAASPANARVLDQAAASIGDADESQADPAALLIIVLILLIAGILPLVQSALPPGGQGLLTNEEARLGLALAVVGVIKSRK